MEVEKTVMVAQMYQKLHVKLLHWNAFYIRKSDVDDKPLTQSNGEICEGVSFNLNLNCQLKGRDHLDS